MVTHSTLTPQVQYLVNQYLSNVRRSGIPVHQAYVFGSQAKGEAKPWSDIDLCVVSPSFGHNRYDERLKLIRLTDKTTLDIEPHPYSPADFNFPLDPLAAEIRKFGIAIR